jgi:CRISPR-associated protein Csh2
MSNFNQRIYGCAIIRSINANYNADFSHQPRTLPNGVCYATDKALKYLVKNYFVDQKENILYFKRLNKDFQPLRLEEAYNVLSKNREKPTKAQAANDLLTCLDVRCFGATFAMKAKGGDNIAISIHGPVQINHGVNIWKENNIFSEQIMSPFADKEGADASTLGRQSKLQEGHYIHHFSVNPQNIDEIVSLAGANAQHLSADDITKLKEALRKGATYFDSAAKAGIDNEVLICVTLNVGSKAVLPTFNNLVKMDKEGETVVFDTAELNKSLERHAEDIEKIELYYLADSVKIKNAPASAIHFDISSGKTIAK